MSRHYDPYGDNIKRYRGVTPFARRLQCLRCGAYRWERDGEDTACPGCEPNGHVRSIDAQGRECTEFVLAKVVVP